jgi:TonB family protein
MSPNLVRFAVAASLCGALPAVLAEDAKPAAPAHSELFTVGTAAFHELQAADDDQLSTPARFKRLEAFRFSPETAEKLMKMFGTDRPFTFTQLPSTNGQFAYRSTLAPLHYLGADGTSAQWSELSLQVTADKRDRTRVTQGSWPSLDIQDKDVHFALREMSLAAKQTRGGAGLWFGNAHAEIGRIDIEPKSGPGPRMALEGTHFDTRLTEHAKSADLAYTVGIKAISVAGERVDDFHIALHVANIDKRALTEAQAAARRAKLTKLTPEARVAAAKPMLMALAKSAAARGTAIDIDDISAGYQGYRASIKGHIAFAHATEADMDSIPALMKKLVARFDIKVPVGLVRAVSTSIALKQQSAQHPGSAADPQAAAQVAQTMSDVVVGKLLSNGYARLENDVLVSTVEWRDGALRANGKEVALPKPPPASKAATMKGDRFLQARQIAQSCHLPDYPEDVVRQDKPLTLTLAFIVGTNGHLRNLSVMHPSQWPQYDQAALAAAASCTYVPALLDGKPIEMPMNWTVVREAGSARP